MKKLIIKILVVFALVGLYYCGSKCQQETNERKWEAERATPYGDVSFLDYNNKLGGIVGDKPSGKYSIVVGAFRHEEYAKKRIGSCEEAGYNAESVHFGNGLIAVVICPSDNLDSTLTKMNELKASGVCPGDGWILTRDYDGE